MYGCDYIQLSRRDDVSVVTVVEDKQVTEYVYIELIHRQLAQLRCLAMSPPPGVSDLVISRPRLEHMLYVNSLTVV